MRVTWDPQNGEPEQNWDFDPEEVDGRRAMDIEKHYGGTFDQWTAALNSGEIKARMVLLWYMLSEIHPSFKFDNLPAFRVKQLKVQMGVAELQALWKRVQKMKLPQSQRDAFEAAFEGDLQDALEREGRYDARYTIADGQLSIEGGEELPKPA